MRDESLIMFGDVSECILMTELCLSLFLVVDVLTKKVSTLIKA